MKMIFAALICALFTVTSAQALEAQDLGFSTQSKIINALLASDEAQNYYVGEASISDIIGRDLAYQMAGNPLPNTTVKLSCEKVAERTLSCTLFSLDADESGESALIIQGKIHFQEFSTELEVSEVTPLLAG